MNEKEQKRKLRRLQIRVGQELSDGRSVFHSLFKAKTNCVTKHWIAERIKINRNVQACQGFDPGELATGQSRIWMSRIIGPLIQNDPESPDICLDTDLNFKRFAVVSHF